MFRFFIKSLYTFSLLFFRELIEKAEKVKAENKAKGISSKKRKWEKRVQKFIARRKERQAQRALSQETEGEASKESAPSNAETSQNEPAATRPAKKQKLEQKKE